MHSAIKSYKRWRDKLPDNDQAKKKFSTVPHVITSNIEHCATTLPLKNWESEGEIG